MGKDSSVGRKLLAALAKIDRPGTFCTSGTAPAVLPGLEIDGVGTIGVPPPAGQAKELKQHFEQAPYGKGTKRGATRFSDDAGAQESSRTADKLFQM
jgi:hypothetical protein